MNPGRLRSFAELRELQASLAAARPRGGREVVISTRSTCCQLRGSRAVEEALERELASSGLSSSVTLRRSGCLGFCEIEPMVIINPEGILYPRVTAEKAAAIVRESAGQGKVLEDLLYVDPASGRRISSRAEVPFYRKQERFILGANETIDPTRIEDYLAGGGYSSLARVLAEMRPEEVIAEIGRAGLRGRGGGGFPTARKWESCLRAEARDGIRTVICNADEGDPGAYMDRSVLEANPHSVIEGMIIGAYAVGSTEGFIYVRAEYPLAVEHLRIALGQAEARGLLGDSILGAHFSFSIRIVQGAGAFVCGESTALMASLEGKVGRPRAKYVHTVERGYLERPTVLNNVETWANVTGIIASGVEAYTRMGSSGSKGTKIFSLVGKIHNTGLVEVPMGIPLRQIIFDIGGGIPQGRRFKAVQTGGPSGGCLPESLLDLPVDFDALTKAGSMMGSGGMIVMDEDTCMVDVARYFLEFLKGESCGKCVPCREGIRRMLEILEGIVKGEGRMEDLDTLEEMASYLSDTALCALGATAANPVRSTLKYFRGEYETHILERYCPAGVCKSLYRLYIDEEACTGCGACLKKCPASSITGERKKAHHIDEATCLRCGICLETCRFKAIRKGPKERVGT